MAASKWQTGEEEGSSVLISRGKGVVRLSCNGVLPMLWQECGEIQTSTFILGRKSYLSERIFLALCLSIRASKINTFKFRVLDRFCISHANADTVRHKCKQEVK